MIVFDNGTQFECDPVIDIEKRYQNIPRRCLEIILKNTTFEAVKPVFTSGELFSIQDTYTDEEGTQHTETYPKPEFCICGGIKDNLDGTIFVEMFGKTDAEMEMEQMQQAYNILIGKEQ